MGRKRAWLLRGRARAKAEGLRAVSRDERNEYHGMTVERAGKVLDALRAGLVTHVEMEPAEVAARG